MVFLSRSELEERLVEWDRAVGGDPGIDPVCSRALWQVAFHDAFEPRRRLVFTHEGESALLLAEAQRAGAPGLLEPLENMWGFGSPLAGFEAGRLLARLLRDEPRPVLLLGVPYDRERLRALGEALGDGFGARSLEPTVRYVAHLEGGLDGWLSRRSASFRRNLRAAGRRVQAAGVVVHRRVLGVGSDLDDAYALVLDVESRGWKAREGRGVDLDPMKSFYRELWGRAAAGHRLLLVTAELAGRPIGYLHGLLCGDDFRGLQFSYDDGYRSLGLGNVMQAEMLSWLADEGALRYDLGTHAGSAADPATSYKRRWAEEAVPTLSLLVRPLA